VTVTVTHPSKGGQCVALSCYLQIYIHTYTHIPTYTHTYTHQYNSAQGGFFVALSERSRQCCCPVCVCVFIYIHTYIHTCTHQFNSAQGGFFVALSGGADSAAVAAIVGSMCQLLAKEVAVSATYMYTI
jgi:hypothetical protein